MIPNKILKDGIVYDISQINFYEDGEIDNVKIKFKNVYNESYYESYNENYEFLETDTKLLNTKDLTDKVIEIIKNINDKQEKYSDIEISEITEDIKNYIETWKCGNDF